MTVLSDADRLIGAIYDAAFEPHAWPSVLATLSRMIDDSTLYMCHVPLTAPTEGYTWTHEFDPDSLAVQGAPCRPAQPRCTRLHDQPRR